MELGAKNLTEREGLVMVAIGFGLIALGILVLVVTQWALVFSGLGVMFFGMGYYQWSPIKSVVKRGG